jgi:two-component SAPR family response regulator
MVGEFTSAAVALSYARSQKKQGILLEFALLDIEMPEMSGLDLAPALRELYPDIVVIFLTGHDRYAVEALHLKMDYYMLKPYDHEEICECVERARLLSKRSRHRVFARTFGRFDLFTDEQLVVFNNAKAKELLALCVDHRGGNVTMEEAIDKLWEDRAYDSKVKQRYRTTIMQLRKTLREYHVEELFESRRGSCHINVSMLDCDYYDLLEGKEEAVQQFGDQYMEEYSWAEETLGSLFNVLDE